MASSYVSRRPIVVAFLFVLSSLTTFASGDLDRRQVILELPGDVSIKQRTFDLGTSQGVLELAHAVEILIAVSEAQQEEWKQARADALRVQPITEMSHAQLKRYFHPPEGTLTAPERRGLKEIRRLCRQIMTSPGERPQLVPLIQEVAAAVGNNRRPPAPRSLDLFAMPLGFWDQWRNPVARGRRPASNLDSPATSGTDLSNADPLPSTFWSRPASIANEDLYHGFGRDRIPRYEDELCEYLAPKTSYGGNPGFAVRCGGLEMKIKLAETTSEPFAARIFHALGYHVNPTDHARQLKIRYDRRLFREFHLRREIDMRFLLFACLPVYTMRLQRRSDPFDYIAEAVLKDGSRASGSDLKRRLLRHPEHVAVEDYPDNFKQEFEAHIAYLVTTPVNVEIRDPAVEPIGPWDFGQLNHDERRELRGLALLAAWLGWYDSRLDNTRLKIVSRDGRHELLHFVSDVGGGLGRSAGFYSGRGELPNEFEWTFTRAPIVRGKGRMTTPFRITGFKPIEDTAAFEAMTTEDARWMARLIGQLSERQLVEALVAAGFDSAHVRLYTEKLVSRRDRMIADLGLGDEIPPLRPGGAYRQLSYHEAMDGPVTIRPRGGEIVTVRPGSSVIWNGRLQPDDARTPREEPDAPTAPVVERTIFDPWQSVSRSPFSPVMSAAESSHP